MRTKMLAALLAGGCVVVAASQANTLPINNLSGPAVKTGMIEHVHCTPRRWHHVPTFRRRADGCLRPARKGRPSAVKKAPAADTK
jgi:hypothetical protein